MCGLPPPGQSRYRRTVMPQRGASKKPTDRGVCAPTRAQGDQPRPAFGFRPWFAFLRRARSLRRFALAMVARRVPVASGAAIPQWRLMADEGGWTSPPTLLAETRRDRRRGLRPAAPHGIIIETRSVHGFGMCHDLTVLGLDGAGVIVDVRTLRPRRIVSMRDATWIVELPPGSPTPLAGVRLQAFRRKLPS